VVIRYLYKQHAKELKEKDERTKSIKERKRSIGERLRKRGANNGGYQRPSK
jgi:uncharacterized protein with GYD domain